MALLRNLRHRISRIFTNPDFLALLCLFVLPLIFLYPVLLGGKVLLPIDSLYTAQPWSAFASSQGVGVPHNPLIADMILQNFSWKEFAKQSYLAHQFPLWNPYIFSGMPFLAAGQYAALYPLGILFYIMPVAYAYGWFTALHLFLAGAFTYLFCRILGLARFSGLVSGVTFMFSAFLVVSFVWPMILSAAVWLPFILAMIELVVRGAEKATTGEGKRVSPTTVWVLLGGLGVGMQLLAGHLEISFYVLFSAMLFAAFRLSQMLFQGPQNGRASRTVRTGLLLCALVAIGFGLAAAQLLPFFEVIKENFRAGYTSYDQVVGWALPKRRLLTFLVPDLFGNPSVHSFFDLTDWTIKSIAVPAGSGSRSFVEMAPGLYKNYVEGASYVGLLPLLLAPVALFFRRRRYAWFFAGYAVLSLLLAFGTPLYRILWVVPGFNQLHTPFRWILPYSFCLAILAGFGLEVITEKGALSWFRARFVTWLGALAGTAGALVLAAIGISRLALPFTSSVVDRLLARSSMLRDAFGDARLFYSFEARNFAVFGLILLAAGLLIVLLRHRPDLPILKFAILALLVGDLFVFGQGFNTTADERLLHFTPPAVAKIQEDKDLYRIVSFNYDDTLKPDAGMMFGLQDIRGYDTIILKQYVAFWRLLEEPQGLTYSMIHKLVDARSLESPLLDLMNVKYVLTTQNIGLPHYTEVYRGEINVYRNDDVLPRAFAVFGEQRVGSEQEALTVLGKPGFDPRTTVVLENAGNVPSLSPASSFPMVPAKIESYEPNIISIRVSMPSDGYLILSDSFFAGWHAQDGGQEVPVLRADRIFRAVRLSAGDHVVTFKYSPMSFQGGLYASFITSVAMLLIFALWLWRRFYREMETASTVHRIVKNSATPMAAQLLTKVVDFAFAMLYIRVLGSAGVGQYTMAIVVWTYFSIFSGFGLGQLVMRDVARDRSLANRYLSNTVILRVMLSMLSIPFVLAIIAGYRLFDASFSVNSAVAILLFTVGLFPSNLSDALAAICYAHERMEYPAAISVVTTLLKVTFGAAVLYAGWGVIGLAAVSVLVNLVTLTILWQVVRETFFVPRWNLDVALIRRMLTESFPFMINNLLASLFFRIDVLLLEPLKGVEALGFYSTSYKFIDGLNIIPSNFTLAIFPIISRFAQSEKEAMTRAFRLSLKVLLIVSLPLTVGIALLSEKIILVFSGPEFLPHSAIALSILIWFLPFSFVNSVTQYVLIAVGKQRFLTFAFFVGVSFNLIANLVLIPRLGYAGAAWTTVLSEIVLLVPFLYASRDYLHPSELVKLGWRPALAALTMGLVVHLAGEQSILLLVPLGAVVYCFGLVALRTFERDEIALVGALRRV